MNEINIIVNGQAKQVKARSTIADLIAELGLGNERIAVERNGEFLQPGQAATTMLQNGDKLELVRFVGGG